MIWTRVESTVRPEDQDLDSSKKYNFVRRNIEEEVREQEDGENLTIFTFEEARILKEDWGVYLDLVQAQADIDYLNMITEDL